MTSTVTRALRLYLELFDQFIDGDLDAATFLARFARPYLADSTSWGTEVFDILDSVFASADAYEQDDELRPQVIGAIDGDRLLDDVRRARAALGTPSRS